MTAAQVTARGAERWVRGHPWIYRSDVEHHPPEPGLAVEDREAASSGRASCRRPPRSACGCWSGPSGRWTPPGGASGSPGRPSDARVSMPPPGAWWQGDGLPSLVVDRYDRWIVAQILSAGLETMRQQILDAVVTLFEPEASSSDTTSRPPTRAAPRRYRAGRGLGATPDRGPRRRGALLRGAVGWSEDRRLPRSAAEPDPRRVSDATRWSRARLLRLPRLLRPPPGRPRGVGDRPGLQSRRARAGAGQRGAQPAGEHRVARGGRLRGASDDGPCPRAFDTIVLDPPPSRRPAPRSRTRSAATARSTSARCDAWPRGTLLTASCSFHVRLPDFLGMLAQAAGDSGRRIRVRRILGAGEDHPES